MGSKRVGGYESVTTACLVPGRQDYPANHLSPQMHLPESSRTPFELGSRPLSELRISESEWQVHVRVERTGLLNRSTERRPIKRRVVTGSIVRASGVAAPPPEAMCMLVAVTYPIPLGSEMLGRWNPGPQATGADVALPLEQRLTL